MLLEVKTKDVEYQSLCQNLLEVLIINLMRRAQIKLEVSPVNKANKDCVFIEKYIDAHFKEDITLDKLSELTFLNKYHIVHAFKQYKGISPISYMIQKRIHEAKILLSTTNLQISEISPIPLDPSLRPASHPRAKASQTSGPRKGRNQVPSVFCTDMRRAKNTSQPESAGFAGAVRAASPKFGMGRPPGRQPDSLVHCPSERSTSLPGPSQISHDEFYQEYNQTPRRRHQKQVPAEPGHHNPHHQGRQAGPDAVRGVEDGGEGHGRQGDVGDVVEEGAEEGVLDLPADEGEGEDPDEIGPPRHHQDVEIDVMLHGRLPPFPPSPGTGRPPRRR